MAPLSHRAIVAHYAATPLFDMRKRGSSRWTHCSRHVLDRRMDHRDSDEYTQPKSRNQSYQEHAIVSGAQRKQLRCHRAVQKREGRSARRKRPE